MREVFPGTVIRPLLPHADERGHFIELWREEWGLPGEPPLQWNTAFSRAGTLRGVHAHPLHDDYFALSSGSISVGLHDLRSGSPTFGASAMVELTVEQPALLVIPQGVAHGFYYHADSVHTYAGSRYFDPLDELECRWDSPELGLLWPMPKFLSERDRSAGSYQELVAALRTHGI